MAYVLENYLVLFQYFMVTGIELGILKSTPLAHTVILLGTVLLPLPCPLVATFSRVADPDPVGSGVFFPDPDPVLSLWIRIRPKQKMI